MQIISDEYIIYSFVRRRVTCKLALWGNGFLIGCGLLFAFHLTSLKRPFLRQSSESCKPGRVGCTRARRARSRPRTWERAAGHRWHRGCQKHRISKDLTSLC